MPLQENSESSSTAELVDPQETDDVLQDLIDSGATEKEIEKLTGIMLD